MKLAAWYFLPIGAAIALVVGLGSRDRGDDGIGVETGELGSVFLFVLPPARIGNKIGKPPSVPYLHSPEADTEGEIHVAGAALDGDVPVAERFSDLVWPDAS